MNFLSRFLARFGYVRLKDYGYALSPSGKIAPVVEVDDDRFAPPPWQPVAWQSATSLLPPAPKNPPIPRPLAPPPGQEADEAEPAPLFRVPAVPATVETAPPGKPVDEDEAISIDEAPPEDAEEWEWKMALARAREAADKDKKGKEKAVVRLAAASSPTPFPTSALPLSASPARKVMDAPRPMNRIPRAEPKNPAAAPDRPITRLESRTVTAQPVAARATPRTAPPKAPPPGRKSRPMPAAAAPPPRSAAAKGVERPLPRIARGTGSPAVTRRPTEPRMALGSSGHLPAMRDPSQDVTATDITAVDRAWASTRNEEEDTRVNVVVAPSADITLDTAVEGEPELEATTVDGKPNGVGIVAIEGASPLPRLTARLRRHSVPN